MKPYAPDTLPLKNLNWDRIIPLIGPASSELSRYDGILQGIVDPAVFLSPLSNKEAELSSRIEGTNATLEDVLVYEASSKPDHQKKKDIHEIINYRDAMFFATEWLEKKPLTLNLIKEIHTILLSGVRGRTRARGEFRKTQNWIGKPGATIENASFVPPSPEKILAYLSNLEKYIHQDDKDSLVQLALVHAQFEIIHPFLDGNGRVGRILIPLFLFEKRMLKWPTFYISAYLEANREAYYANLKGITQDNNWEDWIIFFLTAVIEQSKSNTEKIRNILDLYEGMKVEIPKITRSKFSVQVLDLIFSYPVFNSVNFVNNSGIPKDSAKRILRVLKSENILRVLEGGKGRTPSILMFTDLMDIVN